MSYFDTTSATASEHKRYVSAAKAQDKAVLNLFVMQPKAEVLAPSEVHETLIKYNMIGSNTPLTSIRRSINTLTKQGQLLKTEVKKRGPLGRSEYAWKLAPVGDPNGQMRLF